MSLFEQHTTPVLIGVVHLLPLPGAPTKGPGMAAVLERARTDARALMAGGVDALIVENFGDAPFAGDQVDVATIACMTRIVTDVVAEGAIVGVNVLRNDAQAAVAIAAATGARFVRINVHTGVMVTDQGVLEGQARQTLLLRRRLGSSLSIVADVHVKHASPLASAETLEQAARDARFRGHADVLVITGAGTGRPASHAALATVAAAVPKTPIWVGSGVTLQSAPSLNGRVHGAIVGTSLHRDGDITQPIDADRVRALRLALCGTPPR
jgi:membrane complex biogenesis BtpA family protein